MAQPRVYSIAIHTHSVNDPVIADTERWYLETIAMKFPSLCPLFINFPQATRENIYATIKHFCCKKIGAQGYDVILPKERELAKLHPVSPGDYVFCFISGHGFNAFRSGNSRYEFFSNKRFASTREPSDMFADCRDIDHAYLGVSERYKGNIIEQPFSSTTIFVPNRYLKNLKLGKYPLASYQELQNPVQYTVPIYDEASDNSGEIRKISEVIVLCTHRLMVSYAPNYVRFFDVYNPSQILDGSADFSPDDESSQDTEDDENGNLYYCITDEKGYHYLPPKSYDAISLLNSPTEDFFSSEDMLFLLNGAQTKFFLFVDTCYSGGFSSIRPKSYEPYSIWTSSTATQASLVNGHTKIGLFIEGLENYLTKTIPLSRYIDAKQWCNQHVENRDFRGIATRRMVQTPQYYCSGLDFDHPFSLHKKFPYHGTVS